MEELKKKIEQFISHIDNQFNDFDDTLVGPSGRAAFYQDIAIDCHNFIVDINAKLKER